MPRAIKQIFVIVAVVGISMVFVLEFRPGTDVAVSSGPTCVLEISGECIPHGDFLASYRLAAPNVDAEAIKQMQLRRVMVDGLIERWLLNKDAARLGITVSEEEVTEQLGKGLARFSLPVAQQDTYLFMLHRYMPGQLAPPPEGPARRMLVEDPKTGKFDYERYKRWVGRMSNKTLADFRDYQRTEAIAARMRALIRARVRVSENEAYERFARSSAQAVVDYIKLERGFYADHVVDRSDAAVASWAEQHSEAVEESWSERKDRYLPECRQARHILVRFDETLADEQEQKAKAQAAIEAIDKRLKAGEAFATLAKELSNDPRTAPKGGKLGCFAAGRLTAPNTGKAIDDAVFSLKAGRVSQPIETDSGLHLVKLDKVLDAEAAEKLGRHEIALERYLESESERLAAEGGKQILEAVRSGKSLEQALAAHLEQAPIEGREAAETDQARPQVMTSDAFTPGTPPFAQVENPVDASKVLLELDKPGAVPDDLIKLYDGYAVAQLKEHKPVDKNTWEDKREEVMASMRHEKQRDALAAYILSLRDKHVKELTYHIKLDEGADPE